MYSNSSPADKCFSEVGSSMSIKSEFNDLGQKCDGNQKSNQESNIVKEWLELPNSSTSCLKDVVMDMIVGSGALGLSVPLGDSPIEEKQFNQLDTVHNDNN